MLSSEVGKHTPTLYKPTIIKRPDITLRPMKQSKGNVHYVALIESEGSVLIEKSDTEDTSDIDENEEVETDDEYSESRNKRSVYPLVNSSSYNNIFSLGDDPIKSFYVGSVTVIGLYILYKMLTKKR
jgi:hypothetical protein